MSRRHTVLESLAPAVLGSLQGYLSAVGRASPHKAEGLSIGAMPTLPAWSHGERARGPPACRPAHCPSPARRCLVGSSPLRPAEQGLTWAVSHSLPRPSRWPLPSALRMHLLPREPHKQSSPLCPGKWVPGGQRAQAMWCPQLCHHRLAMEPRPPPHTLHGAGPCLLVSMGRGRPHPQPSPAGPQWL